MWFIVDKHVSKPLLQETPWPIIVIGPIWILTVTAMTASKGDAVLLRSTALRILHVVTGYSNNTLSCSELNGEHAGEGSRSIRHIWRRYERVKPKKCHFSRKFDLWPDLTRLNVDVGLKTICSFARCHRDASTVFFSRSSTTIRGRSPGGGGVVPPPLAKVAKYGKRARQSVYWHWQYGVMGTRLKNIFFWTYRFLQTPRKILQFAVFWVPRSKICYDVLSAVPGHYTQGTPKFF